MRQRTYSNCEGNHHQRQFEFHYIQRQLGGYFGSRDFLLDLAIKCMSPKTHVIVSLRNRGTEELMKGITCRLDPSVKSNPNYRLTVIDAYDTEVITERLLELDWTSESYEEDAFVIITDLTNIISVESYIMRSWNFKTNVTCICPMTIGPNMEIVYQKIAAETLFLIRTDENCNPTVPIFLYQTDPQGEVIVSPLVRMSAAVVVKNPTATLIRTMSPTKQ